MLRRSRILGKVKSEMIGKKNVLINTRETYHKPTQKAIKYNSVPGVKVCMDGKLCLSYERNWSDSHHKKIKDESSQASESQDSSNYPTNDRQKCSAVQEKDKA